MTQYLLSCSCGAKTPVSRSQAGMSLPCSQCGQTNEVPTIRNFASLEVAGDPAATQRKAASPNFGVRVLAGVFLLAAFVGLGYGGLMAYERFTFPADFSLTEKDFMDEARASVQDIPPAETWDTWNYIANVGLSEIRVPNHFRYKRAFEANDPFMYSVLGMGAFSLVAFATCVFLSKSR